MEILNKLRSSYLSSGHGRDDLIQFFCGAIFGLLFVWWTAWTWTLIVG